MLEFSPDHNNIRKHRQYLLSISSIGLVSAICFLFPHYIGARVVALILLLTVSLAAMVFDLLPVLVSALLSALVWDFFFLHPRFRFDVANTEDKILLPVYFAITLISIALTFKIRHIERMTRQKEEKAKTLKLYNAVLNSLSHEFRTPIATIIGATDNLMLQPSLLSEIDRNRLLNEISVASLRLNRHVENLLNMSRLESGFIQPKKDWFDLREMAYSVLHQLQEQMPLRKVDIDIEEYFPMVRLDHGLMEQVLYNLFCNAALYTPDNSHIRISARRCDQQLFIIIEDNGPGFPEDEMGKVFGKFYRLKNSRPGGSGLGLSIVKGFIEAQNGTVSLSNKPSGGARFTIQLPAGPSASPPPEKLSYKLLPS